VSHTGTPHKFDFGCHYTPNPSKCRVPGANPRICSLDKQIKNREYIKLLPRVAKLRKNREPRILEIHGSRTVSPARTETNATAFLQQVFRLASWRSAKLESDVKCKCSVFFMALQPFWALDSFQFPDLFTIGRLLGRVISSSQGLYLNTEQTYIHTHTKHPCPKWDSNPWSQGPSERRQFMS
jgi:hypothetical protein